MLDPKGMVLSELRRAFRIVEEHQAAFLHAWRKYHAHLEPPDGR